MPGPPGPIIRKASQRKMSKTVTIFDERITMGPVSAGRIIIATLTFRPVFPGSLVIGWADRRGHFVRIMDDGAGQLMGATEPTHGSRINYETGEIEVAFERRIRSGIPVNVTYDSLVEELRCDRCGAEPSLGSEEQVVFEWDCLRCGAVLCEHQVAHSREVKQVVSGTPYLIHGVFSMQQEGPAEIDGLLECGPVIPRTSISDAEKKRLTSQKERRAMDERVLAAREEKSKMGKAVEIIREKLFGGVYQK